MESQPKYPDPSKKSGCYTVQIKDIDIPKWKKVNDIFYRHENEELQWDGKEPDQCKVQRHGVSLTLTQHANGTFMVQGKSIDLWREEHFPNLSILFDNPPAESSNTECNKSESSTVNASTTNNTNNPTSDNNNTIIQCDIADNNSNETEDTVEKKLYRTPVKELHLSHTKSSSFIKDMYRDDSDSEETEAPKSSSPLYIDIPTVDILSDKDFDSSCIDVTPIHEVSTMGDSLLKLHSLETKLLNQITVSSSDILTEQFESCSANNEETDPTIISTPLSTTTSTTILTPLPTISPPPPTITTTLTTAETPTTPTTPQLPTIPPTTTATPLQTATTTP